MSMEILKERLYWFDKGQIKWKDFDLDHETNDFIRVHPKPWPEFWSWSVIQHSGNPEEVRWYKVNPESETSFINWENHPSDVVPKPFQMMQLITG